jgi:hypothetical protein
MHHYSQQVLCMETKPITENSSTKNQQLSMASYNSFRSNLIPLTTINRHLSMPSYDQVNR